MKCIQSQSVHAGPVWSQTERGTYKRDGWIKGQDKNTFYTSWSVSNPSSRKTNVSPVGKVWDQTNRLITSSWSGGMLIKRPCDGVSGCSEALSARVSAYASIYQDKRDGPQRDQCFLFGFIDPGLLTTANRCTTISAPDSTTVQILFNAIFNFMTCLWFRRSGSLPDFWLSEWEMDTERSPADSRLLISLQHF